MSDQRRIIFNADDFGQTAEITRGIVECHTRGVLTSTSMMVTGRGVAEAVAASRQHPRLAIGLHFDVWGEDEREFDTHNLPATRNELRRQLDEFTRLFDRLPTHIDSHRHAHREPHLFPHFVEWCADVNRPVRGDGRVNFVGGFYGQWEWGVTNFEYIGVPFLVRMLQEEVPVGVTEFSCHPGYLSPDYSGIYAIEREAEVKTLTDPAIRETINQLKLNLISYADLATEAGEP